AWGGGESGAGDSPSRTTGGGSGTAVVTGLGASATRGSAATAVGVTTAQSGSTHEARSAGARHSGALPHTSGTPSGNSWAPSANVAISLRDVMFTASANDTPGDTAPR